MVKPEIFFNISNLNRVKAWTHSVRINRIWFVSSQIVHRTVKTTKCQMIRISPTQFSMQIKISLQSSFQRSKLSLALSGKQKITPAKQFALRRNRMSYATMNRVMRPKLHMKLKIILKYRHSYKKMTCIMKYMTMKTKNAPLRWRLLFVSNITQNARNTFQWSESLWSSPEKNYTRVK